MTLKDEFNRDVTDMESAKLAMSWALEKAEGLSLSVQSLKEQLGQKNHVISSLEKEVLDLQRAARQAEFGKNEVLQKMQSFQDQISSLLTEVSAKEKERLDQDKKHLDELLSLEKGYWEKERRHAQEFQDFKNQITEEYTRKHAQISLEFSQKEVELKSRTTDDLLNSVRDLKLEKKDLENRLLRSQEEFRLELEKRQAEFSAQLDLHRIQWKKIADDKDSYYREEMRKISDELLYGFGQKERAWKSEKEALEGKIRDQAAAPVVSPRSDALAEAEVRKSEALSAELEKKIKGLSVKKDYLIQYTGMLQERREQMEREFSEFINQVSALKGRTGGGKKPSSPGFFSLSFPTFRKLIR